MSIVFKTISIMKARKSMLQLNIRDANNARARKSIIVISFRPRSLSVPL